MAIGYDIGLIQGLRAQEQADKMALQDDQQAHQMNYGTTIQKMQGEQQLANTGLNNQGALERQGLQNQGSLDQVRMGRGILTVGGSAEDPWKSRLGFASGGLVDDILLRVAAKPSAGYTAGGVIPGKVNKAVADDITINAKKGEYIIPQEVVALKGTQFFDSLVKKSKQQLGIPDHIGPKRPDQPDSMGRMDAPGLNAEEGYSAGAAVGSNEALIASMPQKSGMYEPQKAIPEAAPYNPKFDPNNYVNGTAGMYKSLDPRFHDAAAAQGTVDHSKVVYRDRALENPVQASANTAIPVYTNANLKPTDGTGFAAPKTSAVNSPSRESEVQAIDLHRRETEAKIAKAQADTEQTQAETADLKKNGGKASQANQQKDLALFSNGLNSINTMRQRQQALRAKGAKDLTPEESKELQGLSDDAIEQYEERLAKLHPELAAKAGIQVLTPEQKVARQNSRQIASYMEAARKQGADETKMADVLSKAGYKDEYIRQAIPTYKGGQPQQGVSTVAKRTQDGSQKPPMEGARLAPDGNWYVQKDGKYHMVVTGKEEKSQKKIRLEGM